MIPCPVEKDKQIYALLEVLPVYKSTWRSSSIGLTVLNGVHHNRDSVSYIGPWISHALQIKNSTSELVLVGFGELKESSPSELVSVGFGKLKESSPSELALVGFGELKESSPRIAFLSWY